MLPVSENVTFYQLMPTSKNFWAGLVYKAGVTGNPSGQKTVHSHHSIQHTAVAKGY